jgi:hypothetical protein
VESWLIIDSPSGGLFTAPMLHLMSVHEMRIQQCVNGSVRDAADAVAQGELALLAARGAGGLVRNLQDGRDGRPNSSIRKTTFLGRTFAQLVDTV